MKIFNISGSRSVLLAALVFLLVFPCVALGVGSGGDIAIYLNGSKASSDVSPYIDGNSRTMVPLRFISESMGGYVEWSKGTQKITIKQNGCVLELTIGSNKALVDNKSVQLDTQPVLKEGRTMVPIRFVSEQLGCIVSWNVKEQAVYISSRVVTDQEIVVSMSNATNANVRKGPGTTFPIISTVRNGTILNAVSTSGGWYEVLLADNSKGWISATIVRPKGDQDDDYEEPEEEEDEDEVDEPSGDDDDDYIPGNNEDSVIIIANEAVNIRQSASADSPKIAEVYKGQEFPYLGEQGDWYKIQVYGQVGWVANWLASYKKVPTVEGGLPSRGPTPSAPLLGKTIVIDPGHGSLQIGGWSDPGAVSPSGFYERDIVIRIATAAGKVLSDKGATVIYSRTGSKTSLSLAGRADLANSYGADVFVAVHCNAAEKSATAGTSTYYYTGGKDYYLQSECERLAALVQEELVKALGRKNLGIIDDNFAVIRETKVPSILVETAFLSNPEEEQLLLNYDFQVKAGKAIADGISRFLGQ